MRVYYTEGIPSKNDLFHLFESTHWNGEVHLSDEEYFCAVQNSWYLISAFCDEKLIGFGRIISDGILHALLIDLMVLPEFQNQGIGANILKRLVDKCILQGLNDVKLFSAKGKSDFYLKYGFIKRENDAPGMELKLKGSDRE